MDAHVVTAYLRDLVRVFVEGVGRNTEAQRNEETKAINSCFQLFLGRDPTADEKGRITPWW